MWIKYSGLGKILSENSLRQELLQVFTENTPGVRSGNPDLPQCRGLAFETHAIPPAGKIRGIRAEQQAACTRDVQRAPKNRSEILSFRLIPCPTVAARSIEIYVGAEIA